MSTIGPAQRFLTCYYTTDSASRALGLKAGCLSAIIHHAPNPPSYLSLDDRRGTKLFKLGDIINWLLLNDWKFEIFEPGLENHREFGILKPNDAAQAEAAPAADRVQPPVVPEGSRR